jgi:transposase-like protein
VASRSWVKAHSPYWSLHVEAWRQSGMARADYCRQHGLSTKTFERWMKHLISKEEAREHAKSLQDSRRQEQRRQQGKSGKRHLRPRYSVRTDTRSRALQAFWAMHVEAMNWAGMGVREYASGLRLSPYALRKWRDRFENAEVAIDWRAHLHPSACPQISTGASSAAKDSSRENDLTAAREAGPPHDGRSNRRSFTDEEKLAVVLQSEQPSMSVAEVCRRHRIVTSMVFRWRVQFGFTGKKAAKLATVTLPGGSSGGSSGPAVLHDLLHPPDGMMPVQLPDGRRVFAPEGSDPEAVRQHVLDREAAR